MHLYQTTPGDACKTCLILESTKKMHETQDVEPRRLRVESNGSFFLKAEIEKL